MAEVSRRNFIKLAAASTAAAVVYSGCTPFPQRSEFLSQSPAAIPEDLVSGSDNWYATVCRGCGAGCGSIVRVFMGRALKVEGNPDHPVNRGGLCARGQAAVQALYHPDRFRGPLRRTGERGANLYERISWDTALNDLLAQVRNATGGTNQGTLLAVTGPLAGHRQLVLERLVNGLGGQQVVFEPLPRTVSHAAVRQVFGQEQLPHFDIGRSRYLLSFGADFLGTWLSPVHYSRAYGEFRQGRPERGYFVQIEPRLSQTGASADEWLPVRAGSEGALALSIAHVLVSDGLADQQAARALLGTAGASALDAFAPDRASQSTGVRAEKIVEIARAFASQRPALAIGGDQASAHSNGLGTLSAIYALNVLAGSVGRPGGVIFAPPSPFADLKPTPIGSSFAQWQQLVQRLQTGQPRPVNLLLLHNANPVYGLPRSLSVDEALKKVPYIVSFSSFPDETTALADLILPDHVALEAWGDAVPNPMPGLAVVGFQQPLVNPLYDTRDLADVLLALAGTLGGEIARALPARSYLEVLRGAASELQALGRGSVRDADPVQFWNSLLQKGGWWETEAAAAPAGAPFAPQPMAAQLPAPTFAGGAQEYPYNLIVYAHLGLGEGEGAYLPWMQSLPDPTTSAAWQSWVEVNPETAKTIGIASGDVVTVESPNGAIEVSVYVYPGIAPEAVAIPLGQGHSIGRWAKDRGVNPLAILAPMVEASTGSLAWGATRVKVRPTGRKSRLPTYEYALASLGHEVDKVAQVTRE